MKKLKNHFTTIEQSKRLLELGVPANSADCYYDQYQILNFRTELDYGYDFFELNFRFIPCWSVGRLIEVHLKCCTALNQNDAHIVISRFGIETGGLLQNMYDLVGECALLGRYDFSKLEEE